MPPPAHPPIPHCRTCNAPIWWGFSARGRLTPYDVDLKTGDRLPTSHFATCPQAKQWSRKGASGAQHGGVQRAPRP